jgi:exonuclease VII small subunit
VTDRASAAFLPGETPVEDLPLRRYTINALRAGHVLTLGELRAMRDRELMALRQFGRGALADVRSLVPAPAGEEDSAVTTTDAALSALLAQLEVAEELAAHAGHALAEAEEADPPDERTVERCRAALEVAERRLEELRRRRRELDG